MKLTITALALSAAIGMSSAALAGSGCNVDSGLNGIDGLEQGSAVIGNTDFAENVLQNRMTNSGGDLGEFVFFIYNLPPGPNPEIADAVCGDDPFLFSESGDDDPQMPN